MMSRAIMTMVYDKRDGGVDETNTKPACCEFKIGSVALLTQARPPNARDKIVLPHNNVKLLFKHFRLNSSPLRRLYESHSLLRRTLEWCSVPTDMIERRDALAREG